MTEDEYTQLLDRYESLQKEYQALASRKDPKFLGMTASMLGNLLWFLAVIAALATGPNGEEISSLFSNIGELMQ